MSSSFRGIWILSNPQTFFIKEEIMNAFSKMVLATAITLGATQVAFANNLISCTQPSSSNPVMWSFATTSLASERLASSITYNNGSGAQIIFPRFVAQYLANASQLYILIDDPAGNILYTFNAYPKNSSDPTRPFSGVVTTFTADQPSSVVLVKCTSAIV
jgi:hypothetical protein